MCKLRETEGLQYAQKQRNTGLQPVPTPPLTPIFAAIISQHQGTETKTNKEEAALQKSYVYCGKTGTSKQSKGSKKTPTCEAI